MKNLLLFLGIFCITAMSIQAQSLANKVTVQTGPISKFKKGYVFNSVICSNKTGMYVLNAKSSFFSVKYQIEYFNSDMMSVKTLDLNLEYKDKKMDFEAIREIRGKIYLFTTFKNQDLKKQYLFAQEIDKNSLVQKGELKSIGEIDYAGFSKGNSGNFVILTSSDTSKVLVYYNMPNEKKGNEKFGLYVYSKSFKLLWEKQIELPYTDKLFGIQDFILDNKGNVHVLGKAYKNKVREKGKDDYANYTFKVLSYYNKGADVFDYDITNKSVFLKDMRVTIGADGNLICTGFYSKDAYSGSIKGSFFLKLNSQTKEMLVSKLKEFDFNFVTENYTARQKKRAAKREAKGKEEEMYQFDMRDIITKDDGGVIVIAEQYYVRTVTTTSTVNGVTTTTTTYYYYYNDIMILNISPEGEFLWTKRIPKYQVSTNDGGRFLSYCLGVVNDKMYFVINDAINKKGSLDENIHFSFSKKRGVTTLVEVDSKGNMQKEILLRVKNTKMYVIPKMSTQISNKELLLFSTFKKKKNFTRVTFK